MTNARFAKLLVWINGSVPAVLLLWDARHGGLGANPVNFAIRTTGLLALVYLIGSLAVTPVRKLSGFDALIPHRRTLGLLAAFFAFAHFGIFFWWDRERSLRSTWHEIFGHPPLYTNYLIYGLVALLIFVPLTLTSTTGMIRRLGPKNWKRLHRLVYVAAIFGGLHYVNVGKFPSTQAIVLMSIIQVLLLFRLIAWPIAVYRRRRAAAARPTFWRGTLRIAEVVQETPDVRTFRLVPPAGGPLPFSYLPGQYLNLVLDIDGKKINRSYTIASSPTTKDRCEISVKREDMGLSSRHLHDTLGVGRELQVSAPAGRFTFTGDESMNVVLIAGGVGITPLMSKLRYLTDRNWPGRIDFIFVARDEPSIIFRRELESIQHQHPNVHVTISLTRATNGWAGEHGRLSPDLLRRAVPDLMAREFHICGPDEMAAATRDMLAGLGVPAARVKFESFTPPSRSVTAPAADAAATDFPTAGEPAADASLTFDQSGQTVDTPDGQTILELAEAAGLSLPFDCRSGICGTCKTKLISGRVAMETQDALTAADKADRIILTCQAKCLDAVTVDA